MRVIALIGAFVALCAQNANAEAQNDCECERFPMEPEECVVLCLPHLADLGSYTYEEPGEYPRANVMASDAAKQIYGIGFPVTTEGHPVLSATLYDDPDRFGWTDVSNQPSKVGAIAVWPTMSGLVVKDTTDDPVDGQGTVTVLYPSHKLKGKLRELSAEFLGEGVPPKFVVPASALRDTVPNEIESES